MSLEEGPVEIRRGRKTSFSSSTDDEQLEGICDRGFGHCLLQNLILLLLLVGIIIGIVAGVTIRTNHPDWSNKDDIVAQRNRMYLQFPGKLFIRMLKMMIIPLIVSSLISGMAGLPGKARGRIGGFAVLYYMITTLIAVIIGIILVTTIKPGSYAAEKKQEERIQVAADFVLDLIRNVFPENIIAASFQQTLTTYDTESQLVNMTGEYGNVTDEYGNVTEEYQTVITAFHVGSGGGTNVLGLVVFSVVLGVVLGGLKERGRALKECVDSLTLAIIGMVRIIIWFAPVGVCFLLAEKIVSMDDPEKEFTALGVYMATVVAGLAIHAIIILPIIYVIFTRKNPFPFIVHMLQALVLALGTASSSATLPVTMRCMTLRAKVDKRIAEFVLPVGATINMDGTALYEAVAAIFIAQINGIDLNAGQTIIVAITSTAAAIGAAGVPEAGLVTMSIVLTAVGLPLEDVALILAVDWLLDRFRTCVNVWGDSVGCGVVEALTKDALAEMDRREEMAALENGEKKISGYGHHNPAYIDGNTAI